LSMPILFAMFGAMRMMANEQLVQQTFDIILTGTTQVEPFLWVKNLWMPDSPFNAAWPSLSSLQMIEAGDWLRVIETLSADTLTALSDKIGIVLDAAAFNETRQATIEAINAALTAVPEYVSNTSGIPYLSVNLLVTTLTVVTQWNGLFLLPLLSAGSQFLMTVLQPAAPAPTTGPDGKPQSNSNGFMKWFFPLFSLWICAGYNAAFAVYWVTSNLIAMLQTYLINWHLDRKEKLAAEAGDTSSDNSGLK
ncbi:MAG: YidC/Oxa1 family membrane protein insertase, partial [Clostridia bacterium]|nr:YidC/Oxa1 family membrane protein insertase [Clostridia bacterium]